MNPSHSFIEARHFERVLLCAQCVESCRQMKSEYGKVCEGDLLILPKLHPELAALGPLKFGKIYRWARVYRSVQAVRKAIARAGAVNRFRVWREEHRGECGDRLDELLAELDARFPEIAGVSRTSLYRWDRTYCWPFDLVKLIDVRGGDAWAAKRRKERQARAVQFWHARAMASPDKLPYRTGD